MSPRRDPRRIITLTLMLAALGLSSCVFSPKEQKKDNPIVGPATTQAELIQGLSRAYQERDYNKFVNLFPLPTDNASYLFFLDPSSNPPVPNWDLTEELRIHRRMFLPQDPLPGETPVPTEYWLSSISISLTQTAAEWSERTDLYKTDANPEGLDSAKWKATEAEYRADVFFDLQGPTDYRVDGRASFVVIEDLSKASGTDRKFLIYRWEDLGTATKPAQTPS